MRLPVVSTVSGAGVNALSRSAGFVARCVNEHLIKQKRDIFICWLFADDNEKAGAEAFFIDGEGGVLGRCLGSREINRNGVVTLFEAGFL